MRIGSSANRNECIRTYILGTDILSTNLIMSIRNKGAIWVLNKSE